MKIIFNKEIIKVLGTSVAFTVVISLGARYMINKYNCKIDEKHAHIYTDLSGLKRPIESEDTIYKMMLKDKDNFIYCNSENSAFLKFLDDNNLYSIEENIDTISNDLNHFNSFTEYEYKYKTGDNEKVRWTTLNNSKNLTGRARDCYYVYTAYKIVEEDNNYKLLNSGEVNDLLAFSSEYPYIKANYYKVIKDEVYQINLDEDKKMLSRN